MRSPSEGKLLRVFIGEADKHDGRPLYQAIIELLRSEGMAGGTVLRGVEGFGAHAELHTHRILTLSDDLPIVIECADRSERIEAVLPRLDAMIDEGVVTVEAVELIVYRRDRKPG